MDGERDLERDRDGASDVERGSRVLEDRESRVEVEGTGGGSMTVRSGGCRRSPFAHDGPGSVGLGEVALSSMSDWRTRSSVRLLSCAMFDSSSQVICVRQNQATHLSLINPGEH